MRNLLLGMGCVCAGLGVAGAPLELDVPAGTTSTYTSALGADVTELKKTGGGTLRLGLGTTTSAFTGAVAIEGGTLGMDAPRNLGRPSSVSVSSGATLDLSAMDGNVDTLDCGTVVLAGGGVDDGGAVRRASGGVQDALLRNFTLADDATVFNSTRCGVKDGTFDFGGHALEKRGGGEFLLHNGTYLNMGDLVLNGGQLTMQGTGAKFSGSETNRLVVRSGTLCLWGSPGAGKAPPWTLELVNNFTLTTGQVGGNGNAWDGPVVIPSGRQLVVNPWGNGSEINLSGPLRCAGTVLKQAAKGVLRITGATTTNDYLSVSDGRVVYGGGAAARHEIGQVTTANNYGEVVFADAGRVHQYRGGFWVAGNGNNLNTVSVTNTLMDGWQSATHCAQITLGDAENYNGRLVVDAGAVLSNRFNIGHNGRGAVHQRGGDVWWQIKSSSQWDFFGSHKGYAFYGLDGGTLVRETAWMGMGVWDAKATAFFVQRGGSFSSAGGLCLGGKGYAELYVGGGTHVQGGGINLGQNADYPEAGGATVTVANGADLSLGRSKLQAQHTNGFCAVVNVNSGGRLTCSRFSAAKLGASFGSELFLNADGGVLRPAQAWGFSDEWAASANDPTRATVYDGGLVLDASDCASDKADARIPFPFQRPYGKGIRSIALPPADSPFWNANFLGPTRVRISGAGKAATALVDFELGALKPRGVIVTSPGFGYDDDTVVTVDSWDGKTAYPCAVELFDHEAKGGVTLRGTMGVTRIAANTWGGPTTVESATLTFATAESYPVGSPLVLRPAGAVDFNGVARTLPSLSGAGTVRNADVTVTNGLSFFVADAMTNACLNLTGRLTLADGAKVAVLDPENLEKSGQSYPVAVAAGGISGKPVLEGVGAPWKLFVRGNEIRFGYCAGTTLLLR